MHPVVNTHQAAVWNGEKGQHWADNQERYDTANQAVNDHLFAAAVIGGQDRILDIGCGNGQTTRLAARRAPRGHVVGVDLSAPMLERARATAAEEGVTNVRFEQGDAQAHPFASGGFDLAISRGGIMYFADQVAAFANIDRALRPGGRLVTVSPRGTNGQEDFTHALRPLSALLQQHSPAHREATTDRRHEPPSLADPDRVHEVLTSAGFENVTLTPIETSVLYGRDADDATEFIFSMGSMSSKLGDAVHTSIDQAREAVTANLRAYEQPDGVRLRSTHWLVTAGTS